MRIRLLIAASVLVCAGCAVPEMVDLPELDLNDRYAAEIEREPVRDAFAFMVIGDTRPADNPIHRAFLGHMVAQRPLFAVNVGDFVDHGRGEEYDLYRKEISDFDLRYFHVVGNHDNRLEGYVYAFGDIFGEEEYYFDYGKWRFIVLNNCHIGYYGFSDKQLRWLESVMRPGRHCVVFAHAPPKQPFASSLPALLKQDEYPKRHTGDIRQEEEFLALMDRRKPRLVIFGHNHMYASAVHGGTRYLVSGGGGSELHGERMHPPEYGFFYHYLRIDAKQNGAYSIRVFGPGGQEHADFAVSEGPPGHPLFQDDTHGTEKEKAEP